MKKIVFAGIVAVFTTLLCGCDGQGNIKFNLKIDSLTIKTDSGTYVVNTDTTINLKIKNTTTVTVEEAEKIADETANEVEDVAKEIDEIAKEADKVAKKIDESAKMIDDAIKEIE